jgi:membrane associated rhomboid family serine protease
MVVNFVFGVSGLLLPGTSSDIAWQTHLGGFLAGLLLFPLFDPVRALQHVGSDDTSPRA